MSTLKPSQLHLNLLPQRKKLFVPGFSIFPARTSKLLPPELI